MTKKLLFFFLIFVIMFIIYLLFRFLYLNISPYIHSWRGFFDMATIALYFLGGLPLAGYFARKLVNQTD